MNTLCYVRQGRKFVPVPDYTGYFYGMDGFKKEETFASYAIVVSQDINIATLAYLGHSAEKMTWDRAKAFCASIKNAHVPSLIEMFQAIKFRGLLRFETFDAEWTFTEIFSNGVHILAHCGWYMHWAPCEVVDGSNKNQQYYVRPFFKINVLTGERIE